MNEKQLEVIAIIPLAKAVLCQDCQAISNGKLECPACGSKAIANVMPWLERKDDGDRG